MTQKTSGRAAHPATKAVPGERRDAGPLASGDNRRAVEATLAELERMGRLETTDAARVQMLRSMADALDRKPWNSQMWKVYGEALGELTASGDDDDEAIQAVIDELQSSGGNATEG